VVRRVDAAQQEGGRLVDDPRGYRPSSVSWSARTSIADIHEPSI
jgi:hypothetical protein